MLPRFNAQGTEAAGNPRLAYGAAIAFIVMLCLIVVGHDIFRTWEDRRSQLANSQREVANLAFAAEQHSEAAFALAETVLNGLRERVENDGTGTPQLERLSERMKQGIAGSMVLESLTVIDLQGNIIAAGRPIPGVVNVADRDYFQYHKTHPDRRPYVTSVLRARMTGKPVISLTLRINQPDGGFAGVAAASVAVGYFQQFFAALDLGRGGIASLYRDDGTLLVREPFREGTAGVNYNSIPLFRDLLPAAPKGTFEAHSTLDGETRIVSYRRVTGYPLLVTAGLDKDEQLAAWRTSAIGHLAATAGIAALLAFVGVSLVMQVRRLTKARQAAAAATQSARIAAARFQLIADNASDMIITVDMNFVRQYVSPASHELLGCSPEELINNQAMSITHPDDHERARACLLGMAAGRDRDLLSFRMHHRDGHWVWVEASLRLIRDPATGAPLQICAAIRDITQRLTAQTALDDSERALERTSSDLREVQALHISARYARELLEASLDPMITTGPEGRITDVNAATVQVTGVPRETLIGTNFSDHFTNPARAQEAFRQIFSQGPVRDYPLTIRHVDGTLAQVSYNASVYKNADGAVLGMFAAARDVTARMEAEAEIARQRGKEQDRLEELERFHRLTIGRELKMIELKKEILALQAGNAKAAQ